MATMSNTTEMLKHLSSGRVSNVYQDEKTAALVIEYSGDRPPFILRQVGSKLCPFCRGHTKDRSGACAGCGSMA